MTEAETAVADVQNEGTEVAESPRYHLSIEVNIENVGPCKKHVRVKVPRSDIDHFMIDAKIVSAKSYVTHTLLYGSLIRKNFNEK